jgi:iron complex transport system permease protein
LQRSNLIKLLALLFLFVIGCALSLLYGGSERLNLTSMPSSDFIFWQIRCPKTITAIIAGSTLSISGLILQILFRNPLAGPYVLGISSGASLTVALCMLAGTVFHWTSSFFVGKSLVVASAIVGSFAVTLLILLISKKVNNNVVLLLIGMMLSQICGALQMALEYFTDPNSLKSFVIWGMGSLANTTNRDLIIFVSGSLITLSSLLFFVKPLNALLLGQNYAQGVGVSFNKNRYYLILISSALTGITTAFCGPIAFVGIAVPVISRLLFSSSKQQLHVVSCLLIGSILLLFSDVLCNSAIKGVTLPVNMITTFVGAPLVIYLMFKNKHW